MRDARTPLLDAFSSFLMHRHDLSEATVANYRFAVQGFAGWCESNLDRTAEVGDVEPGTVEAYLVWRTSTVSPQSARSAYVALRSLANFLAERKLHHDHGESKLRLVRTPKVKDDARRALSDTELFEVLGRAAEGEMGPRDSAIVWTLSGCGLRRGELAALRLQDLDFSERCLRVQAATSKSAHSREVSVPVETLKALDKYVADHRVGDPVEDAPLFTDRGGNAMTGNAIRKLFERLRMRTKMTDLSAHLLRHTWATNFHRSGSGTRFDLMAEGGWTTGRMVERYTKSRPFDERRRAPSPFTAPRKALAAKRSEKRPPQQRSGPAIPRVA